MIPGLLRCGDMELIALLERDERYQRVAQLIFALDGAAVTRQLQAKGLNDRGTRESTRSRLVRAELRECFPEADVPWEPEVDEAGGVDPSEHPESWRRLDRSRRDTPQQRSIITSTEAAATELVSSTTVSLSTTTSSSTGSRSGVADSTSTLPWPATSGLPPFSVAPTLTTASTVTSQPCRADTNSPRDAEAFSPEPASANRH
ncbi:hypothetical protein QAD02_013517 [Eretmocerus hayati]|uniref:Uncharacterized protein n=1 Tax=Eretmocerus hayati TaxID=131215 RepID=A0ACC2P7H5_9HYME|nr:hypothetical protein QAD02_013517 [Eretmocerus hayati]